MSIRNLIGSAIASLTNENLERVFAVVTDLIAEQENEPTAAHRMKLAYHQESDRVSLWLTCRSDLAPEMLMQLSQTTERYAGRMREQREMREVDLNEDLTQPDGGGGDDDF